MSYEKLNLWTRILTMSKWNQNWPCFLSYYMFLNPGLIVNNSSIQVWQSTCMIILMHKWMNTRIMYMTEVMNVHADLLMSDTYLCQLQMLIYVCVVVWTFTHAVIHVLSEVIYSGNQCSRFIGTDKSSNPPSKRMLGDFQPPPFHVSVPAGFVLLGFLRSCFSNVMPLGVMLAWPVERLGLGIGNRFQF